MFFYYIYYGSYFILIPGIIFAFIAQSMVKTTFNKYSKVGSNRGWVANEMAQMLLERKAVYGVSVRQISGSLTDNYNPSTEVVSLSQTVYGSSSISALGVAGHEIGHVLQKHQGSILMKIRTLIFPVVRIGSMLAVPVAIAGVFIESVASASGDNIGTVILMVGVIMYALSTLFSLLTLPIEIDASRRAIKMLLEEGVIDESEVKMVKKVLFSAGLTYFASLLMSLLYLLRFLSIIARIRGNRD